MSEVDLDLDVHDKYKRIVESNVMWRREADYRDDKLAR